MQQTMEELGKYSYQTQGELVDWLKEQLVNFSYDQIQEKLEEVLKG
jgi:hypothetical protein